MPAGPQARTGRTWSGPKVHLSLLELQCRCSPQEQPGPWTSPRGALKGIVWDWLLLPAALLLLSLSPEAGRCLIRNAKKLLPFHGQRDPKPITAIALPLLGSSSHMKFLVILRREMVKESPTLLSISIMVHGQLPWSRVPIVTSYVNRQWINQELIIYRFFKG